MDWLVNFWGYFWAGMYWLWDRWPLVLLGVLAYSLTFVWAASRVRRRKRS